MRLTEIRMKPTPALIVFDLDGTLVDSAPDLAFSVDALLEKLNRPPAGFGIVCVPYAFISQGGRK
jgi:phosphoglycolate phosphatase-like HAD superfamily hydrolase